MLALDIIYTEQQALEWENVNL